MGTRNLETNERASIEAAIRLVQDPTERLLLKNYRDALDKIRAILSKLYEKYSVDGSLTLAEMSKFDRLKKLERQIFDILGPVVGKDGTLIDKLATVRYKDAFYRQAWAIDQATGVEVRWGLLKEQAIRAAVENPLRKIAKEGLKRDGLQRIRREVTQGLIRGDSYPKMAKAIKGAFDTTARDTLRIARTEGQRAQVLGQQAAYEEAEQEGVQMVQVWDATLDARTRPEHGALDGKEATYNDDGSLKGWFVPGIGWVLGPLQSGVPSFDINCRCRIRGQIKGYAPKVRRVRGEGVVPYKTYSEWASEQKIKVAG